MFTAKLHQLRPSAPPTTTSSSSTLRRRKPASFLPSPSLRSLHPSSLVVVSSAKKLLGRRRPSPRVDRLASTIVEEEEETNAAETGRSPSSPPSGDQKDSNLPPSDTVMVTQPGKGKVEATAAEAPLRGLDVLKALQKAAAQKGSGSGRKEKRRGGGPRSGGKGGGGEECASDVGGEVRPLEIKEDWWPRLEALEKQIQEVQEEQHGH